MKKIALLIYEDAVPSCISGVIDILSATNYFLQQTGKPEAFTLELISEKGSAAIGYRYGPGSNIYKTLEEVTHTDLIIAPAFNGRDIEGVLQKNKALTGWIKEMNKKGTEVASLCFGSYFLAEAGLLSGKPCTSHWMAIEDMRRRYPDVKLLPDRVMTDQDGIYTSGGAFSSLNLVLYLIEKFCGREVVIWVSKMFSIDLDKSNQSHFAVFQGQHQHEDAEILQAQKFIEQNFHLEISVETIAEKVNMSKRNFIRRFKNATQNTPLEYLQRVKMESAKKELEKSAQNINTLMYNVGYNDVKTFRKVFKRVTGLTPQDYRRKYSRTLAQTG
ncbi:GlxA family transcriptional regulator [Flavitalea flava]